MIVCWKLGGSGGGSGSSRGGRYQTGGCHTRHLSLADNSSGRNDRIHIFPATNYINDCYIFN